MLLLHIKAKKGKLNKAMEGSYMGEARPLPITYHECLACHPLSNVRIFKCNSFWLLTINYNSFISQIEIFYCPFCSINLNN